MSCEIIPPVSLELLKSELTEDKRLRMTNRSSNVVYIVTYQDSPNVVREIGRLREIAFRAAGGGSGLACDLDEFDTCEHPYKQLVVWDPENEVILGGYRYRLGRDVELDAAGQPLLATSHLFRFSERFIRDYLPYTIELGRSFVTLEYQSTRMGTKGLFALDNLWDGLGALMAIEPECKYFFGKFTMYPSYDRYARDLILHFLHKYFHDAENLIEPICPLQLEHPEEELAAVFTETDFRSDYKILSARVRERGLSIPPLVNAYMNLSPTMKLFGTAINDEFGDVEETGILITFEEMLHEKRVRHMESFLKECPDLDKFRECKAFFED